MSKGKHYRKRFPDRRKAKRIKRLIAKSNLTTYDHEPDLTNQPDYIKQRFAELFELADMYNTRIYFIDGAEGAICGYMMADCETPVPIYDYEQCLRCFADGFDDSDYEATEDETVEDQKYRDAIDWMEVNTLRALPYLYEKAPVLVHLSENARSKIYGKKD